MVENSDFTIRLYDYYLMTEYKYRSQQTKCVSERRVVGTESWSDEESVALIVKSNPVANMCHLIALVLNQVMSIMSCVS